MKTTILISISASIIAFLAPWRWDLTRFTYDDDPVLEIAFPSDKAAEAYDPARIIFAHEYIFLEGIYSPLIIFSDANGAPYSAVARKFYWKGNELHFVIRQDMKTIDGHLITAEDVLLSVKRLLILSQNTHGDFKSLVCPNTELKKLSDDCPGMLVEGHTFILRPTMKRFFILDLFASIDFAIIPKGSYDPVTLKITDYRNTSGPHYVAEDRGQGRIILKANPTHIRFEKTMAQEIHLIPTKGMEIGQVINLFNQGQVDHIITIAGLEVADYKKIDLDESHTHETIHLLATVAHITDKGKKRLPLKKRLAFAKALQSAFHEYCLKQEGCRPARQFFLPLIGGLFPEDDEGMLKQMMDSVEMETSGEGIFLGISTSNPIGLEKYVQIAKKYMPGLKVKKAVEELDFFVEEKDENIPDYIMVFTDSGFLENIGLLSYSMNQGTLGHTKAEAKAWLKGYMETQDKMKRNRMLRKMHLHSLTQGLTIPLFRTPYMAFSRKPWRMHLPQIFANNQFWKIRKD